MPAAFGILSVGFMSGEHPRMGLPRLVKYAPARSQTKGETLSDKAPESVIHFKSNKLRCDMDPHFTHDKDYSLWRWIIPACIAFWVFAYIGIAGVFA